MTSESGWLTICYIIQYCLNWLGWLDVRFLHKFYVSPFAAVSELRAGSVQHCVILRKMIRADQILQVIFHTVRKSCRLGGHVASGTSNDFGWFPMIKTLVISCDFFQFHRNKHIGSPAKPRGPDHEAEPRKMCETTTAAEVAQQRRNFLKESWP